MSLVPDIKFVWSDLDIYWTDHVLQCFTSVTKLQLLIGVIDGYVELKIYYSITNTICYTTAGCEGSEGGGRPSPVEHLGRRRQG